MVHSLSYIFTTEASNLNNCSNSKSNNCTNNFQLSIMIDDLNSEDQKIFKFNTQVGAARQAQNTGKGSLVFWKP